MKTYRLVSVLVITAGLLTGCAAAVVGSAVGTATAAHDRRTLGTLVEDQNIRAQAYAELNKRIDIQDSSNISISVYNLTVLLTGQAESAAISKEFAELVRKLPRVARVYNEVAIASKAKWTDSADDMYLTSKAKLALFKVQLEGFDPTRVKVVTSGNTVYLMGLLSSQEADAVTEQVRYVRGVKRVVKLFEYTTPAN